MEGCHHDTRGMQLHAFVTKIEHKYLNVIGPKCMTSCISKIPSFVRASEFHVMQQICIYFFQTEFQFMI